MQLTHKDLIKGSKVQEKPSIILLCEGKYTVKVEQDWKEHRLDKVINASLNILSKALNDVEFDNARFWILMEPVFTTLLIQEFTDASILSRPFEYQQVFDVTQDMYSIDSGNKHSLLDQIACSFPQERFIWAKEKFGMMVGKWPAIKAHVAKNLVAGVEEQLGGV